jgi:PAS domain S-box-containing protein
MSATEIERNLPSPDLPPSHLPPPDLRPPDLPPLGHPNHVGAPARTGAQRGTMSAVVLALSVFVLGVVATYFAWRFTSDATEKSQHGEFAFQARQWERRITQRMATYEQVERGTQAFLLGSMQVPRDDFRTFVATLRLDQNYPGIQGIALAEIVMPDGLAGHTATMRRQVRDYAVHPMGERALFSTITQIEPYSGLNLRALGFDMLTEPTRRAAMERSRDTGLAAASGKVRLIQENGKNAQAGLVMYLPVYRRGTTNDTVTQRRTNIIGWVGAPFRMDDLMAGLGGERSQDITLSIYDGDAVDENARLYRSRLDTPDEMQRPAMYDATRHLVIAGRPWTLHMRSAALFEQRMRSDQPQIIGTVGTLAAAMLALLVWSLASSRGRAMALASHMTEQLSESEYRWKYALEGAGDGVWDWDRATGQAVYSRRWKEMLGYSDDEIGGSVDVWRALLHPDDAAGVEAKLAAYVASASQTYEAQFRMRCKDGS